MKIISGGQTGADRAALDAAITLGIPHGGWLPKGRRTEDGPLPEHYSLKELDSDDYRLRTEKNVIESDGTLIVSFGALSGGSALTESLAIKHHSPFLVLDLEEISRTDAVAAIETWLKREKIAVLNVAGPRASGEPRIYQAVKNMLLAIDWAEIEQTTED